MTVRDMVRDIQREVMSPDDLTPERARQMRLTLTALLGNCNDEIRKADVEYAAVLLRCLDECETANRARIKAETTPEYQRKREARDTHELVQELIRSLRDWLRSLEEEMRLTR